MVRLKMVRLKKGAQIGAQNGEAQDSKVQDGGLNTGGSRWGVQDGAHKTKQRLR